MHLGFEPDSNRFENLVELGTPLIHDVPRQIRKQPQPLESDNGNCRAVNAPHLSETPTEHLRVSRFWEVSVFWMPRGNSAPRALFPPHQIRERAEIVGVDVRHRPVAHIVLNPVEQMITAQLAEFSLRIRAR
jgi:hypothetical protein